MKPQFTFFVKARIFQEEQLFEAHFQWYSSTDEPEDWKTCDTVRRYFLPTIEEICPHTRRSSFFILRFHEEKCAFKDVIPLVPVLRLEASECDGNAFEFARNNPQYLEKMYKDTVSEASCRAAYLSWADNYIPLEIDGDAVFFAHASSKDIVMVDSHVLPEESRIKIGDKEFVYYKKSYPNGKSYLAGDDEGFLKLIADIIQKNGEKGQGKKGGGHEYSVSKFLQYIKKNKFFTDVNWRKCYDTEQIGNRIDALVSDVNKAEQVAAGIDKRLKRALRAPFQSVIQSLRQEATAAQNEKTRISQEKNVLEDEFATFKKEKRLEVEQELELYTQHASEQKHLMIKELQTLEQRCEETKRIYEQRASALQAEADAVHEIYGQLSPRDRFAVQPFYQRIQNCLHSVQSQNMPSLLPPWANAPSPGCAVAITLDELPEQMEKYAALGRDADVLRLMDAFLRAREMVWLLGEQRDWYISAYAACVTGGQCYRMQADPSILNIDDLWRLPGTQEATPLARAWTAAQQFPRRMHLVVIHMGGSPCHLWLPVLFTVLQSPLRPVNLLLALVVDSVTPSECMADVLSLGVALPVPAVALAQADALRMRTAVPPPETQLCFEERDRADDAAESQDLLAQMQAEGAAPAHLYRGQNLFHASANIRNLYPQWPTALPQDSVLARGSRQLRALLTGKEVMEDD